MTFGTLIPLIFLIGIPIIIIIYLMKPKGTPMVIPSLMLWKDAERNEKSMTFSKKLIKNILMFIEIAALLFLMLAAMAPAIKRGGAPKEKSSLIIIDTSGSMQFKTGENQTRFDQAIKDAKDLVEMSSGQVSIISSGSDNKLLINSSRDKSRLKKLLTTLECTDTVGNLTDAEGLIQSISIDKVYVFTDGEGASHLEDMSQRYPMDVFVYGTETDNVSISQMSMKKTPEGLFDISVTYSYYGKHKSAFDISVYDEANNLLDVRTIELEESGSGSILLTDKKVSGNYVRGEVSQVSYAVDGKTIYTDGLDNDNTAYAVISKKAEYDAYLVGAGNVFVEKAFQAATGENLIKVSTEDDITEDKKTVAIYDDSRLALKNCSRVLFNYSENSEKKLDGGVIYVASQGILNSVSDFSFGASNINILNTPEWAVPFMTVNEGSEDEGTVGYFGEHDGVREIVLGFDVRDSEFPLMAEFPIFIADVMNYLADESILAENYISAGNVPRTRPAEDIDKSLYESFDHAGIYHVADENLVVRYPASEADGTITEDSYATATQSGFGVSYSSLRRICLILALLLIILDLVIYVLRNRFYERLPLVARICLIALVVLAIIGINLPGKKKGSATIFLVDMSDSCRVSLPEMEKYLKETVAGMPQGDAFGIVTFGRNAITDQFVTSDAQYLGIASEPNKDATDIESAVRYAAALIPEDKYARIVILSDGKETVGDVAETLSLLQKSEIELCFKSFESKEAQDVYIQSADMPRILATGDEYKIKVTVFSTYDTDAVLKVSEESVVKSETQVRLSPGENTFVLNDTAGDQSIEKRMVTIEASGDEVAENNSVVAAATVDAPKKILLISGAHEDSSGFENLLNSLNIDLKTVSALNAPDSLAKMLEYKVIIIDNCHIEDLPKDFDVNLESYVKDYGGGLITTGGKESYALGGYKDTTMEKILPVDCLPKGYNEAPPLAMVMIIDCSGSMSAEEEGGRAKIDVAVDAAIEAVDAMNRDDQVGVITFSDNFQWRQHIVHLSDKDAVKNEINKIGIQGGTVIKPAVIEGASALKGVDAGVKHILLLTDGEGETTDFEDAVKLINDNNITMSTIAVGSDSDTRLLENLADECGGRYYYSDETTDIPKIFAEEVYLSGDTYYKSGDFVLSTNGSSKLVEGLYPDGLPHISAYVATSIKTGAREVISTDEEEPLLASWQYGLGTAISWMTNASGSWDEALSGMDDYSSMWRRMIDMASMEGDAGNDILTFNKRRGELFIDYQASEYSENSKVTGVYTTPSGETKEINLVSDNPGEYSAAVPADEMGVYSINVRRTEGDEVKASNTAVMAVQFSDEYRRDISNENLVNFINQSGRVLEDNENVFTKLKGKQNNRRNITFFLIVCSVILLILDIVFRRFAVGAKFRSVINKLRAKSKPDRVKTKSKKAVKKKEESVPEIKDQVDFEVIPDKDDAVYEPVQKPAAEKKAGKKKEKKKEQQEPETLDTSALLKKKKDRNM